MQEGETGMKNKKAENAITAVLAAAVLVTGGMSLHYYLSEQRAKNEYDAIRQEVVAEPAAGETQEEIAEKNYPELQIDFAELIRTNPDFRGWLYFPALDISYPVVQGEDNNFYLHQTYEKNYNFAGTIFIDYENKRDFSDCNTLVYGHNMKNGSMFGMLKKYRADETLYNTSKYFWILTPEKDYRYEIIAAYTTSVNSDTYTLFKGPGKEFLEYEKKMFQNSEIRTDATASEANVKDKIVTLSTCTGNQATRFVVQGKRVNAVNPQ